MKEGTEGRMMGGRMKMEEGNSKKGRMKMKLEGRRRMG